MGIPSLGRRASSAHRRHRHQMRHAPAHALFIISTIQSAGPHRLAGTHTHTYRCQSCDKLFKCLQFQPFVALCQKPRVPLFLAALNVSSYAVRLQHVTRLAYIQYTACVCWTGLFTRSSGASFRRRCRCRCRRRRRRRCCRRRRCRADGWAVATSPRHSPTVTRSIPRRLPCALAVPCTLRRHKHTHSVSISTGLGSVSNFSSDQTTSVVERVLCLCRARVAVVRVLLVNIHIHAHTHTQ